MGMLEDLLLGLPTEEDLAEREREYERWMRSQFSTIGEDWASRGRDPYAVSREAAGLGGQPSELIRDVAQARIGERESEEAIRGAEVIRKARERSDLAKQAQQEQLTSMLDMPEDKLRNIRAEARSYGRAGRLGAGEITGEDVVSTYAPRGGGFSRAEMTPELAARESETARWLGGQTERDLAFAVSPEQARRDPTYAAGAAGDLANLRAQRTQERQVATLEQRTANQEVLINSLTESGGKIPFETAMKLDVAGFRVPNFAIGMSRDHAKRELGRIQQSVLKDIEDLQLSGAPDSVVAYLYYIHAAVPEYLQRIESGEDVDRLMAEIADMINRHGEQSGARQFAEYRQSVMAKATQAGE